MALKDKLMTLEDFKAVRDVDVASNNQQFTDIKADLAVFQDYIPGEIQTVTFEHGRPHIIMHTVDGIVVRTDTITYTPISVIETRATDEKIVMITTNLMTLETEVEEQ